MKFHLKLYPKRNDFFFHSILCDHVNGGLYNFHIIVNVSVCRWLFMSVVTNTSLYGEIYIYIYNGKSMTLYILNIFLFRLVCEKKKCLLSYELTMWTVLSYSATHVDCPTNVRRIRLYLWNSGMEKSRHYLFRSKFKCKKWRKGEKEINEKKKKIDFLSHIQCVFYVIRL